MSLPPVPKRAASLLDIHCANGEWWPEDRVDTHVEMIPQNHLVFLRSTNGSLLSGHGEAGNGSNSCRRASAGA